MRSLSVEADRTFSFGGESKRQSIRDDQKRESQKAKEKRSEGENSQMRGSSELEAPGVRSLCVYVFGLPM